MRVFKLFQTFSADKQLCAAEAFVLIFIQAPAFINSGRAILLPQLQAALKYKYYFIISIGGLAINLYDCPSNVYSCINLKSAFLRGFSAFLLNYAILIF